MVGHSQGLSAEVVVIPGWAGDLGALFYLSPLSAIPPFLQVHGAWWGELGPSSFCLSFLSVKGADPALPPVPAVRGNCPPQLETWMSM